MAPNSRGAPAEAWKRFLTDAAFARRDPSFEVARDRKLRHAGAMRLLMEEAAHGGEFLPGLDALLWSVLELHWPSGRMPPHSEWLNAWSSSDEASLRRALGVFAEWTSDPMRRFDHLARAADRAAVQRPQGTLVLGSIFNFAVEPHSLPIVRLRSFERMEQALGWQEQAGSSVTDRYENHVAFARCVEAEMRRAEIPVKDMLDVQSLILTASARQGTWSPDLHRLRRELRPEIFDLTKRALELSAFQKPDELSQLLMLVEQQKLEAVVEVGTGQGGTLACWCQLAQPHAVLISVDLPGGDFGGGYTRERAEELRRLLPLDGQTLHLIREDSHQPSTVETVKGCLGGKQIDLLFIDGDHTYEGVRQDFEMYVPLVKHSGLIAFHDILPHPFVPECQVDLFWREVKDHYRHLELVAPPRTWGGIGILWQR